MQTISSLNVGPCQFPTLGFVVERWRRVQNFVPEPFWLIKLTVVRDEIEVKFNWKRNHLFDRLCCLCLYEMCLDKGLARVASVATKPKSKWKPLPLTTVELQKQGARFLGMSAARIMTVNSI
jgi:DNA topoisomerase III